MSRVNWKKRQDCFREGIEAGERCEGEWVTEEEVSRRRKCRRVGERCRRGEIESVGPSLTSDPVGDRLTLVAEV